MTSNVKENVSIMAVELLLLSTALIYVAGQWYKDHDNNGLS